MYSERNCCLLLISHLLTFLFDADILLTPRLFFIDINWDSHCRNQTENLTHQALDFADQFLRVEPQL